MASQVILVDGTVKSLGNLTMDEVAKWIGDTPTVRALRDGQALVYDEYGATNKLPWNENVKNRWGLMLRGNVILTTAAEVAPLEEQLD